MRISSWKCLTRRLRNWRRNPAMATTPSNGRMSYRTLVPSTIDRYLACEDDSLEDRDKEKRERDQRILRFPHAIMLELSYPEMDFVNRWCWQNFGPADGECQQKQSEYRVCHLEKPHHHIGKWTTHWFVKTDYNFGFAEWYFSENADQERFRANLPHFNWGENYPK
jgi:hypothetical protein